MWRHCELTVHYINFDWRWHMSSFQTHLKSIQHCFLFFFHEPLMMKTISVHWNNFSGPVRLRPWEKKEQRNGHNRPCLRAYARAWETFYLYGLSEGQGLHGHHTTRWLIVPRTASPRHPAVHVAAIAGAPTGQTQQGPWAAGRLPRGLVAPILRQAFKMRYLVYSSHSGEIRVFWVCLYICVYACERENHIYTHGHIEVCVPQCVCTYVTSY